MNAPAFPKGVHVHCDFEQGSERWLKARTGLLTASEFDRIITPTLKVADNPKSRAHLWEIASQRITGYVEPQYWSDAMLRGQEDEIKARALYSEKIAPVDQCGFITNTTYGFTIGCSPDGLIGKEGMLECKSRGQRFQIQTIVDYFTDGTTPDDFTLQTQGELLVAQRKWIDLVSYSGGLPMIPMRIEVIQNVQDAILEAVAKFEMRISEVIATYGAALESKLPLFPTERTIEQEMYI